MSTSPPKRLTEELKSRLDTMFSAHLPVAAKRWTGALSEGGGGGGGGGGAARGRRSSISAGAAVMAEGRRKSVVQLAGVLVADKLAEAAASTAANSIAGSAAASHASGSASGGGVTPGASLLWAPPASSSAAAAAAAGGGGGAAALRASGAGASSGAGAPSAAPLQRGARMPAKVAAVVRNFGYLMERDLDALVATTGYSRKQLYMMFTQFKALCALTPDASGSGIDRATFRAHVPSLCVEDDMFVNRVFDLLDADGSQVLEWDEYLTAMAALERGSRELRTEFVFKCYDREGKGALSAEQLYDFFVASLHLPPHDLSDDAADILRDFSGRVFKAVDVSNSGLISLAEALAYVHKHGELDDVASIFGRCMVSGGVGSGEGAAEAAAASAEAAAAAAGGTQGGTKGGKPRSASQTLGRQASTQR
jgi:hypothetical protein